MIIKIKINGYEKRFPIKGAGIHPAVPYHIFCYDVFKNVIYEDNLMLNCY